MNDSATPENPGDDLNGEDPSALDSPEEMTEDTAEARVHDVVAALTDPEEDPSVKAMVLEALGLAAPPVRRRMTPKIAAALVKAQAAAKAVGHDSKNTHHNYSYTSAEGLMARATDALAAAGLTFTGFEWSYEDPPRWNAAIFTMVVATYYLTHDDGDEAGPFTYKWPAMRGNGRPEDKGIAGALTTMQGYALRALLNIPRPDAEDDGVGGKDIAGRDDSGYQAPQGQAPQTTQTRNVGGGGGKKRSRAGTKPKPGTGKKDGDAPGYQLDGGAKGEEPKPPVDPELDAASQEFKAAYKKWYDKKSGREFGAMTESVFGADYKGACDSLRELTAMTKWINGELVGLEEQAARDEQDKAAEDGGA